MSQVIQCPVCHNISGGRCEDSSNGDLHELNCEVCGKFALSDTAFQTLSLTPMQAACLSHRIRTGQQGGDQIDITTSWLKDYLRRCTLPSRAMQATNIIRFVGDRLTETGEPLECLPVDFPAIVGAPQRRAAVQLAEELVGRALLKGIDASTDDHEDIMGVDLTLDGWNHYEAEKRGQIAGNYGFIAMKFDDATLDPFVETVVKPAVKAGIGYDLVDMRDVAQAEIIDNIMRAQIRDAAFVLVDLTHDNSGAYWEAGYAEGLGKPVIYICERTKFDAAKTHFDTNHCTTVLWGDDGHDEFSAKLVATLRRSLNLF